MDYKDKEMQYIKEEDMQNLTYYMIEVQNLDYKQMEILKEY